MTSSTRTGVRPFQAERFAAAMMTSRSPRRVFVNTTCGAPICPAMAPAHCSLSLSGPMKRRLDMIADPFRQKRRRGERLGFDRIDLLQIAIPVQRSEEHTSELQSLMRISYA